MSDPTAQADLNKRKVQLGVTLIELMITIAIIAIIAAWALPSYQRILERNELRESTEALKNDLNLARSEAVKRSTPVFVNFQAGAAGSATPWCYGISTAASCDCSPDDPTASTCEYRSVYGDQFPSTGMNQSTDITFENRRGTLSAPNTAVTIGMSSTNFGSQVQISLAGRISATDP